jgi:serine beta-lactamase-like protein LACTB
LFTDIAIMRLVERGILNLDAAVTNYVPSFHPTDHFGKPITLRELMAHRSGLCREPPTGNYFDPAEPTLADTIASLNQTELVYEPGTHEKYSNAGVALLGYILEVTQKKPYLNYIEEEILRPLGLKQSSFRPTAEIRENLADGLMWTLHGRTFPAPKFELSIAPAGCMYSSVNELAHFMTVLFSRGRTGDRRILKPETLEEMWRVQFGSNGAKDGFGLGFHMRDFDRERSAGHNGAIYGFATHLTALVDAKIGVVVITSKDFANTVSDNIGNRSLNAMLSVKKRTPFPEFPRSEPVPVAISKAVEGHYTNETRGFELSRSGTNLAFLWQGGGFMQRIRQYKGELVSDGAIGYGMQLSRTPDNDSVRIGGAEFRRRSANQVNPLAERWHDLIGEYGWDHDTLYILEKEGKLYALIEWFEFNPLTEISRDVFRFPNYGLYDGEKLIFHRDEKDRVTEVIAANVRFKRRKVGPEEGQSQLQLKPVRPVAEIRAEALKGTPPAERGEFKKPELVDLMTLDPSLKFDIRYAGTNNFLGTPFYTSKRAFLQKPAAEALVRANRRLNAQGYALLIFDGYRPWFVTKIFWDATPDENKFLVADPKEGSRHNRGAAVDLTLYDLKTGEPVDMVSTYDEATDRAFPDYPGETSFQRSRRKILRDAMEEEGFTVYPEEWWHFDFNDWRKYPIQNIPFEQLGK